MQLIVFYSHTQLNAYFFKFSFFLIPSFRIFEAYNLKSECLMLQIVSMHASVVGGSILDLYAFG